MKATNLATIDHAAHHARLPAPAMQASYAEVERLRGASNLGSGCDEAAGAASIVYGPEPLFGPRGESINGRGFVRSFFAQLDQREQPIVQIVMRSCPPWRAANAFRWAMNWLGNGWLYLFATIGLLLWQGSRGVRPALAGACGWGLAYTIYMLVKPQLRRLRPRDADPRMRLAIEPMDKFSCPSGHCMTATAVAVPLLMSFPQLLPVILGVGCLIAWSRIACGHHYPSDVLLGIGLGIAVSIPICGLIL